MTRLSTVCGAAILLSLGACGDIAENDCTLGTELCQCIEGAQCVTGLQCSTTAGTCVDPNKKPDGADCQSSADCQSGSCEASTVEGTTVSTCAAAPAGQDSGTPLPPGACQEGEKVVQNQKYDCNGTKLYQCNSGTLTEVKNCLNCPYIGPGTGSKYKSTCYPTLISEMPDEWSDKKKTKYRGPGCYFAGDMICGV